MTQIKTQGRYVGWVPCLNGQLVFDLVECGLKNGDSINILHYAAANNSKEITEYILLHSTVNWKDFDNGNEHLNGLWSVVLLSTRPFSENKHQGSLFFLPEEMPQENKEIQSWRDALQLWNGALEDIKTLNYQLNTEQSVDVPDQFITIEQNFERISLKYLQCFKVDFTLEHDGLVWVTPTSGKSEDVFSRQAYYYIKYAWHRHQHHDNRAETLTTVHEVKEEGAENAKYNAIANSLIGDLKRNLVRFKRQMDITSHRNILKAKGIVTYTKALVEILKTRGYIDDVWYEQEINHLHYFQESLEVSYSGIEKDMLLHNQAVNDARAFILFLFSIITPALLVNRSANPPPDYIQWISNWYLNGMNFSLLVTGIIIMLFVFISVNSHFGNFWIMWQGFKKSVAFIVKDREPKHILSNSNVLSFVISIFILISLVSLTYGIYHLGLSINHNPPKTTILQHKNP